MATSITSHSYGGPADLELMRALVIEATAAREPRACEWHVGDLTWGIFQNAVFDPAANIRLWVSHGRAIAVAWFEAPNELQFVLHPQEPCGGELASEILSWGEERCAGHSGGELFCVAMDDDGERIAFLEQHGFARTERCHQRFRRELSDLEGPALPEGFTIRCVGDERDFEERVDIHRDVWQPSKVTLEAYRRLRGAPAYEPELDLVVETTDGRFASYCICWLDDVNGVGEFEPVGTRPAFQRLGLGRALILEALRRLREHGMRSAIVQTPNFNESGTRLYQSAGFEIVNREYVYAKRLLEH
jgi:GNAT superfamily N-acetyltransferase